jgi:hypothetical protein
MDGKSIYIVTEGSYSDYHIERVFSRKEAAEKYIQNECQTGSIEEFRLEDNYTQLQKYIVTVTDDHNNVTFKERVVFERSNWDDHGNYWRTVGTDIYHFIVVIPISRASSDLALKIVQDWYTQIKAMNLEFKDWGIITGVRK